MTKQTNVEIKRYRFPGTVVARFVARRTYKSATVWALIFGAYMADKSLAYASAYKSTSARASIAKSFGNNAGLKALLGTPHNLQTIAGFANWNTLGVLTIIGSIWGLLLATKYFRGEEDKGRSEMLLSGPTTGRRAAINSLIGLFSSLLLLFLITAAIFVYAGQDKRIDFSPSASLFFALSSTIAAALFISLGALMSQVMPTRARASGAAALIFGISLALRATGDITSLHWLLYLTPLGWIEKLQPLIGSQPIWLLPLFGLIALLCSLSVWQAGQRDLGDSLVADRDSARAHTRLLGSMLSSSFRLARTSMVAWLMGGFVVGFFYGFLTKAAVQAFNQSKGIKNTLNKAIQVNANNEKLLFLGIVFFLLTAITMAHAANSISKVRQDEADGYIDNFLVRCVGRYKWLSSQAALAAVSCLAMCLIAALGVWLGQALQSNGIAFMTLVKAGINMMAPSLFIVGAGIFCLGVLPRLTVFVAYGILGWSFLVFLLSSGVNINHWILDSSLLHQISLAPATSPNWTHDGYMSLIGLGLFGLGLLAFNRRDIQPE